MSHMPEECPGLSELRAFLDRTLPALDQSGVAGHVEACAVCRSQLEHLTEDAAAIVCDSRNDVQIATGLVPRRART